MEIFISELYVCIDKGIKVNFIYFTDINVNAIR